MAIALYLTMAAICRRMSTTLKSREGWITLEQILGRKVLTDVSQILTQSGRERDMGLSYAKEIVSISSAV